MGVVTAGTVGTGAGAGAGIRPAKAVGGIVKTIEGTVKMIEGILSDMVNEGATVATGAIGATVVGAGRTGVVTGSVGVVKEGSRPKIPPVPGVGVPTPMVRGVASNKAGVLTKGELIIGEADKKGNARKEYEKGIGG